MSEIWTTSDLHLCHNREFLYRPRGFDDIHTMNLAIVENWNNLVASNDDVYVLGDLMLNDNDTGLELIRALKGNLHIIVGNHDSPTRLAAYAECPNVVDVNYALPLKYGKLRFWLSHYPTLTANADDGKQLGQLVVNLCGHSHVSDPFADWSKGRIFHCEMDTNNCTPWHIDDIIYKLKERVWQDSQSWSE